MPLADELLNLTAQSRIAKHAQVCIEDRRVLIAKFAGNGVAIALNLIASSGDGAVEPIEFVLDGIASHEPARMPLTAKIRTALGL